MNAKERLAQALMSSQAVVPPTPIPAMPMAPQDPGSPGAQNPYLLNQPLEAVAQQQGTASPLHPLVAAIMQHMGLMNIVRNHNNQMGVDPENPAQ